MAEALSIGASVVGVAGSLIGGQQEASAYKASSKVENELANYRAKQLEQNAGQARATAQRAAIGKRKEATLARSRARAVAGAQGAGFEGSVQDILAGLTGEGEYNAQSALYEGEEQARGMEDQAKAERYGAKVGSAMASYQAKAAKRGSYLSAAGHMLQGSASMYDKYWPSDDDTSDGSLTMIKNGTKFGKNSSQVAYG